MSAAGPHGGEGMAYDDDCEDDLNAAAEAAGALGALAAAAVASGSAPATAPARAGAARGAAASAAANRRPPAVQRRQLNFWQPFNEWWRAELAATGARPAAEQIRSWYDANSTAVWGGAAPTLAEARVHAKCLRSVGCVREYFRGYRARKRGHGEPGEDGASSQEGSDSEWPAARGQGAGGRGRGRAAPRPAAAAPQQQGSWAAGLPLGLAAAPTLGAAGQLPAQVQLLLLHGPLQQLLLDARQQQQQQQEEEEEEQEQQPTARRIAGSEDDLVGGEELSEGRGGALEEGGGSGGGGRGGGGGVALLSDDALAALGRDELAAHARALQREVARQRLALRAAAQEQAQQQQQQQQQRPSDCWGCGTSNTGAAAAGRALLRHLALSSIALSSMQVQGPV
ncbi:MAG: hypothetical protein J3K34DRAFT_525967 [Monoraphidium minutum]|nr:MAG: hypothetical protein J3K34DRAFT_525967 [Monoraphidium minutum]